MPTFKFEKPISDIEDPELIPKDWYKMRISVKPEIQQNAAKDGENLFMRLKIILPDDPEFDERELPLWLSMPKEGDEKIRDNKGNKISDLKMKRIIEFTEAAGGVVDEEEFDLSEGSTIVCYIDQGLDRAGKDMENSINIFQGFRSAEDEDVENFGAGDDLDE